MIRALDKLKLNNPRRIAGYLVLFATIFRIFAADADTAQVTLVGNGATFNGQETYTEYVETGTAPSYEFTQVTVVKPATKRFAGWYMTQSLSGSPVSKSLLVIPRPITPNLTYTYYAKWVTDSYSVNFSANGGSGSMSAQARVSTVSDYLPANSYTRSSHRFLGWDTSSEGKAVAFTDGQYVNLDGYRDSTGNVTLYAVWRKQFKIKFDGNGAVGSMSDQVFEEGIPQNLTKCKFVTPAGYSFGGWTCDKSYIGDNEDQAELTYDSEKWSGTSATLCAKWVPFRYNIAFSANCASFTGSTSTMTQIPYGTKRSLSSCGFCRIGYTFVGWSDTPTGAVKYANGAEVSNLTTVDGATVTLYAKWNPNAYVIRFNAVGGSGTMADMNCRYDQSYSLTQNAFTRTGATFMGWSRYSGGIVEFQNAQTVSNLSSSDNAVIDLYAVWSINKYYVAFDGNGAEGSVSTMTCLYGTVYAFPANGFRRAGYRFLGWENKSSAAVYNERAAFSNLTATAGVTVGFRAKWDPISYTIGFDANGGEGTMAPINCIYDQSYNLPPNAFTRVGAQFLGWTAKGGSSVVYRDGATVSNLTTVANSTNVLQAVWSINEYHLSFDGNGGIGVVTNMTCRYGKVYAFPSNDFVRAGYRFDGWTNSASATVFAEGAAFSNLTTKAGVTLPLFAKWKPITYRIAFDGNGATSGSMSPIDCIYDVATILTSNAFINSGLKFSGWAMDRSSLAVFADGATVSNLITTADDVVSLFAVWKHHIDDYNVALDNRQLVFWKDHVPAVNRVSVFDDATAVNGSCIRIVPGTTYTDEAGFHLRTDSAGTLIFNWRVVDEVTRKASRSWSLHVRDISSGTNLWDYIYTSDTYGTNMTAWARVQLVIPYAISDIYINFSGMKSNASEFSARFDNFRWGSTEELNWLDKYFPGGGTSLADPNPLKPGSTYRDDFIAGTDPTNALSKFVTLITFTNDVPYISWKPDLGAKRVYQLWGSSDLIMMVSPTNSTHRFFKVTVDMP